MAKQQQTHSGATPEAPPAPPKFRKFEAPDEDLTPFGVQAQQEDFIDGFVSSDKVRALLDAFGLHDRKAIAYPFQHMKRAHGEIWSMRIEPASDHTVDNELVHGHHWIYKRDMPERNAGAQ